MIYNSLFASAADALLSRYRSYITDRQIEPTRTDPAPEQDQAPAPEVSDDASSGATDSQAPKTTPNPGSSVTTSPDSCDDCDTGPATQPSDSYEPSETSDTSADKPTYSFARKASMNYKLRLEFSVSTLQQIASSIADGDEGSFEKFVAAGFGLKAGFDIRGKQVTQTQTGDQDAVQQQSLLSKSNARFNRMGIMRYRDRSFAMQSFYREAMNVRRKMHVSQADGFTRTVNKFAMRYRLDSSFSMSHLSRFTGQTSQLADQQSADLGSYLNTAGQLAEKGTNEMMSTFFGAVDDYLDGAEASMIEKAGAFFDQAAAELGFDGEMASMAREHIIDSVTSFFDRVDQTVSQMASRYVQPEQPVEPDQTAVEPPVVEPKFVDPAVADETTRLATA